MTATTSEGREARADVPRAAWRLDAGGRPARTA